MTTSILWRPEINSLTSPQSYRPRHMARATFGNEEVAARIALRNPVYNEGLGKGFLEELAKELLDALVNGNQVRIAGAFTCHLSFTGRLDAPDDPLPPLEECLHVKFYPSKELVEAVRQRGQAEKEAMSEKLPVISAAQDTVLKLDNVLNPQGLLRVTGTDLLFDPEDGAGQCVLEGTRSGRAVQTRFGSIFNTEITILPDIPAQTGQWNNEYQLSVSTHYTEKGTVRTGVYKRMLRSPLAFTLGDAAGILSDGGASPLVSVTGGTMTAASTRVRIQAVLDVQDGDLRLSLLDMKENDEAAVGNEVRVSANGSYTLTGYAGSALTSLNLEVSKYAQLLKLVKSPYGNRLADILDISQGA
jgi:hypothetical protein